MLANAAQISKWGRFSRTGVVAGLLMGALVLLGVLLAGVDARAGAPSVVPSAARWEVVPPVTANNLRDVYMTSTSNGWAVGEQGTVLHYTGASWQPVNISTTDTLVDVYMVSSLRGYVVGWSDTGSDIFRYDGVSWTLDYSSTATLNSVDGSSVSNVWVVGLNTSLHWNGSQWSVVPIPVERTLFNVRVVSSSEAWAFGNLEPVSGHGLILHNTDGTWVQFPSSAPQTIFDSSFLAPDDGWAVGTAITMTHVHHYDGTRWTWVYTNSLGLFDISMISHNEGWAAGRSEAGPTIAHFTGGDFVPVEDPLPRVFLNGIFMVSAQDGWIVGEEGATLHYHEIASTTATPTPSITPAATITHTPCPLPFTDVQPTDYFYSAVRYLYCHGVISGYSDNTFRPGNSTSRGQMCKIIVLARGWTLVCPPAPTFADVPVASVFYCFVETAVQHGIVSGYSDGTFRPGNNVTRGQLSKIVVLAIGWPIDTTQGPHFSDVPEGSAFYGFVETAYHHQIISGYNDGSFRPGNSATRGQICKIVYAAISQ